MLRGRRDHECLKGCEPLVPITGDLDDVRVCADDLFIGDEIEQHIVHHLAQREVLVGGGEDLGAWIEWQDDEEVNVS